MAMYSPPPENEDVRATKDGTPQHIGQGSSSSAQPMNDMSTSMWAEIINDAPPPRGNVETLTVGRKINIRIQVPFADGPFADTDAAHRITGEILTRGLADFVHESESSASFVWEGEVRRRKHVTLDVETDSSNEQAVREVLTRLHPDRRPAILVTAAA